MQANEQGVRAEKRRYQTIPRTLIFVTSINPATGQREVLLLKGAPTKRLWANRYNGLGGHVEADEDVLAAAERELLEETGLTPARLHLRGVVNIDTGRDKQGPRPGVMVFVFVAETDVRVVQASAEGIPEWLPIAALDDFPLVDDLYALIPLALAGDDNAFFFGHYHPRADGSMAYHFR